LFFIIMVLRFAVFSYSAAFLLCYLMRDYLDNLNKAILMPFILINKFIKTYLNKFIKGYK